MLISFVLDTDRTCVHSFLVGAEMLRLTEFLATIVT